MVIYDSIYVHDVIDVKRGEKIKTTYRVSAESDGNLVITQDWCVHVEKFGYKNPSKRWEQGNSVSRGKFVYNAKTQEIVFKKGDKPKIGERLHISYIINIIAESCVVKNVITNEETNCFCILCIV